LPYALFQAVNDVGVKWKNKKIKKQKKIRINLDGPKSKLYEQLQHLTDILKFSKVAINCATEKGFNEYSEFAEFYIANNHVLNFNGAKEKFHQWCLRNSFRDCVENLSLFLGTNRGQTPSRDK
jgi:hypothetical protein